MKLIINIFVFTTLFLCLEPSYLFAQKIHKDDVSKFVGIIKVTPNDRPNSWPQDSAFKKRLPLENRFVEYSVTSKPSDLILKFRGKSTENEAYSLAMTPNSRVNSFLNIREKRYTLLMLHNGGYESSTSFLSLWENDGDSLEFNRLFKTNFTGSLGYIQIQPDYVIDVYQNLVFVVFASGGDEGWYGGYYEFIELNRRKGLTSLLKKEFNSDYGYENYVLYKFLGKKNLLIETFSFTTSEIREQYNGSNYRLRDRKLVKSETELLDLIELVETAKDN